MAFQRDYVLRWIELMGEFFRRLYQLTNEKERDAALNAACRDQCGLSLDSAMALSPDSLIELLPPQALLAVSEFLYMRAKVVVKDMALKDRLLLRSLRLLSALHEEETLCCERSLRLKELMDDCGEQMTPEDYLACARFFLSGEKYMYCEDAIFIAVEEAREKEDIILQGTEMLNKMLALPEGALLSGGMTRQEILESIDDLEAWRKA